MTPGKFFWLAGLCALLLLGGCGKQMREFNESADFDLAAQPTFYVDDWVRKGPPQVFVHPDISPASPPKAIFMPLRLIQRTENAKAVGMNISRYVWQTWLQEKALPTIEFADNAPPFRLDMALAYARHRNADILIGGTINHYFDGGTVGDSSVSIALELYDVKSGTLMWSFGQSAAMQVGKVNDYLLFAVKTRLPADPAAACIMASAKDLAVLVRSWAYNAPLPKEKSAADYLTPPAF